MTLLSAFKSLNWDEKLFSISTCVPKKLACLKPTTYSSHSCQHMQQIPHRTDNQDLHSTMAGIAIFHPKIMTFFRPKRTRHDLYKWGFFGYKLLKIKHMVKKKLCYSIEFHQFRMYHIFGKNWTKATAVIYSEHNGSFCNFDKVW